MKATKTRSSQRQPRPELSGFACGVCGAPSSEWLYVTSVDDEGRDVIEGFAVCDAHARQPSKAAAANAS